MNQSNLFLERTLRATWVIVMVGLFGLAQEAWSQHSGDLRELVHGLFDTDPDVRGEAAREVGAFKFPSSGFDEVVVEGLADALASNDQRVRIAAARAFSQFTMLPRWQLSAKAIDALASALKDPEISVVKNAGHALGHVNDPRVLIPLIMAMRTEDTGVISVATGALRHLLGKGLATEEAILALIESVGYERASSSVVGLLQLVRDKVPLAPLVKALSHKEVTVRRGAARALAAVGSTGIVEPLAAGLEDEDGEVRRQLILALGQVADPAVLPHLVKATEDRVEMVRTAAVIGLQRKGTAGLEPLLRVLTMDESPKVRRQAAIGLRTIGDSRAAPLLVKALKTEEDYDTWVEIASGALGHWNDDREVSRAIVQALTSPEPRVRLGAAIALQVDAYKILLLGPQETRPLIGALTDTEVDVRKAAVGALRLLAQDRLAPDGAREPLQLALTDNDPEVRRLARETLGLLGRPSRKDPKSEGPALRP